jgi:RNA polymerase sigma factor (sigma-70 family)
MDPAMSERVKGERFEAVFREHYAAVRAYALRRASPDVAQDAVGEAFLVAWRRLDDVPEDALPWLYATCRRTLANERRSARRADAVVARAAAERATHGRDPADLVGAVDVVRAALSCLGEGQREAIMLAAWEELSPDRAATAAGCSRGAFAVRIHRARRRLERELARLERQPAISPASEAEPMEAS